MDILSPKVCLVVTPLLAAAALLLGTIRRQNSAALTVALCGVGLSYGMNAVVMSVTTARIVGSKDFSEAYGLVFTAWGVGGIIAPVVAGFLYDCTGDYHLSMIVAFVSVLIAATAALFVPGEEEE